MKFDIDALQSQLLNMELSTPKLIAIAGVALILLFLSLRVLIRWYLGIERVAEDLKMVRRQLNEIQIKLAGMSALEDGPIEESMADSVPAAGEVIPPAKTDTFRLLH